TFLASTFHLTFPSLFLQRRRCCVHFHFSSSLLRFPIAFEFLLSNHVPNLLLALPHCSVFCTVRFLLVHVCVMCCVPCYELWKRKERARRECSGRLFFLRRLPGIMN